MHRLGVCILIVLCVVGATALPLWPQTHQAPSESSDDWTYVPPSAARSVEVGKFYLSKKNYRGALSRFQEAIHTDADYAPAYLGLGRVYEKMGHKRKALVAYEKYLDELPSDQAAERAKAAHRAIARLKREIPGRSRSPHAANGENHPSP
jgi:tetratricopeptide (TPR) repeat protein